MKTASIGYMREDGDFQLLATVNNNDDIIYDEYFDGLVDHVKNIYEIHTNGLDIKVLDRQDAPDYVSEL